MKKILEMLIKFMNETHLDECVRVELKGDTESPDVIIISRSED